MGTDTRPQAPFHYRLFFIDETCAELPIAHYLYLIVSISRDRNHWCFWIVLGHAAASWFMAGMIWTIHVVHYPLFAYVGADSYQSFQARHVDLIGRLLLVPWGIEGLAALGLVFLLTGKEKKLAVMGALLMLAIIALSAFASAPAHEQLADGFDFDIHQDLMAANFVRALLWTARAALSTGILYLCYPFGARKVSN